ncbi:hypothetical protein [Photobacterium leiognathi]|uniref:hypothetical protein n=1 Tax=Photobacterium leiognathi TaxID=553611 RepID=UPI0029826CD3|nr:hypothetical protein [Photobacterium leiognathi]
MCETFSFALHHVIKGIVNEGGSTSEGYAYRFVKADYELLKGRDLQAMWNYCDNNTQHAIVDVCNVAWLNKTTVDDFLFDLRLEVIRRYKNKLMSQLSEDDRYRYSNDVDDELYDADERKSASKAHNDVNALFSAIVPTTKEVDKDKLNAFVNAIKASR